MANHPFEIPQSLREVSEQNVKQAQAAYDQFLGFVTHTVDALFSAIPANPLTAGFKEIQSHALEIAKDNAKSTFDFAGKIGGAQTLQEILTLQAQFAQERTQAFVSQTQHLYSSIVEAFQRSQAGGAASFAPTVTASVPEGAGFGLKEVRDRAVALAKKNADTAFALVDKIGKAQNVQELFNLQTRFAQEQIQNYASETQELQKVIGEAVRKLQGA